MNSEVQIEIGGQGDTIYTNTTKAALTSPKYWKYVASRWDGTLACYAEVTYKINSTTATIVLQESDGTGDGFTGWADKVTIVTGGASTTPARVRVAFTPTDGRNYRIAANRASGGGTRQYWVYNAKIIIQQSGTFTKLEEQYLLAPYALAAGTANQNFLTDWDSTEWSNVVNTYYHVIDASDNNTSVIDLRTTGGTQLTGSVVTSPDNQGFSTTVLMPTTQNIDVRATTNIGSLFGSRLIVAVTEYTIPPIPNKIINIFQSINRSNNY